MNVLRAIRLFVLVLCVSALGRSACITDASNPGCVHFMMRTDSRFDVYTTNPPQASKDWINSHFWRMQTSWGYFDPAGVAWDPNAWAYVNSSSAVTTDAVVSQHPEWILKSGPEPSGTLLYNGYVNGNGQSSRYAFDIGDPAYRSWWISMAQGVVARGYKGLWIDDVNFDGMHTSDINGNYIPPWDDRTGAVMTYANWKQYFADFVTQIRAAMPNVEILHNSIFYSGNSPDGSDPYVQQEIKAANWINRERGVSTGIDGTGGATDKYSLISFLNFVDTVHSLGANIDIQEFNFNGDYPVACYYLVSSGKDALGNNAIGMDSSGQPAPGSNGAPTNWAPNYDVQLGAPTGARYTWNGMYRRDFANGMVIVNPPGGTQGTYAITGSYRDVSGRATSSVTLPAKTGIILISATPPALSIFTSSLPNGTVGTLYGSHALSATGGTSPYTWSVSSGSIPLGLTLSSDGVISGTPTSSATYNFTLKVSDATGATATQAYSVLVSPSSIALTIDTTSLRSGTINTAYSQILTAIGGTAPYSWSISAGALPAGITLSSGGTISGSPTTVGTYNFTVKVSDTVPNTATQALQIIVTSIASSTISQVQSRSLEGSNVTSLALAFSTANTAHNTLFAFVRASTATPSISIGDSAGDTFLLAASQAQTTNGHSIWLYYANNAIGGANTVTATFSAANAHPWLAIYEVSGLDQTCALDQVAVGTAGAQATSSPATAPLTTTSTNEFLFAGVGIGSTSSTTIGAGAGFTIQQQDAGTSRSATETQTVSTLGTYTGNATLSAAENWSMLLASFKAQTSVAPLSITTNALPPAEISVDYSQSLSASGGTLPYTWAVATGTLPNGLTLSSSGVLSGGFSSPGTYSFTVKATDAANATDTQSLSVIVSGAPQVILNGLPGGAVGAAYSQAISGTNGIPPYVFALFTGSLPPGLSLSSTGVISGTPTVAGDYFFSLAMTDSAGVRASTAGEEIVVTAAPQAQIQQMQSVAAEGTTATTLAAALPNPEKAGDTLILFIRASSITPAISISDTLGNQYVLAASATHNTAGAWTSAIYYAANIKAGVNTVTASFGTTNFHPWLSVYEYAGLDPVSPLDQVATSDTTTQTTSPATATLTTTSAAELIFSGIGLNTGSTTTVSAGTGFLAQLQDSATSRAYTQSQIVGSQGGYASTATLSAADYWSMATATFRASSSVNIPSLNIATGATLPSATVSNAYYQTLVASGGTSPYVWSITSGTLPPGISLLNGILSGNPTQAGTYSFTISASDSGSPPATNTQTETMTVFAASSIGSFNSTIGGKATIGGQAVIH